MDCSMLLKQCGEWSHYILMHIDVGVLYEWQRLLESHSPLFCFLACCQRVEKVIQQGFC